MAIADRVAVMSNGSIVQSGTPEELYRNPNSAFVAGFVGNAMHLDGKSSGNELILEGGTLKLPRKGTGHNVYVRAEDVEINDNGSLSGQVETITFLGTHYRVGIKGIMANLLTSIFTEHSAPKVGQTVKIKINPEALILLPEGVHLS
jgi:putative spermidine/putrescine transport system ATP-binding protein